VAQEIERKLLVGELPADLGEWAAKRLEQGYIAVNDAAEVRIRRADGADARLTVKSAPGLSRVEEELAIDGAAFERLWPLTAGRRLVKVRHTRRDGDLTLELDVYEGALAGLAVLEVEFASEDAARAWTPPPWAGREVSGETAYANQTLALRGAP
jgi:CYTH domain-containing protein